MREASPELMILDGQVVPRCFMLVEDPDQDAPAGPGSAIPLARWLSLADAGGAPKGVGVLIEGHDDIEPLKARLDALPLVALHFPRFADGRGYSHARRLRAMWGYEGVVLAYGDVLRDQLLYMSRCGVNAFYMRADQDPRASLAAFSLYTLHYQYNEI